jgi:hypothetical protein
VGDERALRQCAAPQLQGALLEKAQLQGALLDFAQFQGTSFWRAQLQGASFQNAFVWRAEAREAVWENTRVAGPKTDPKTRCQDKENDCAWTAATFEALKRLIIGEVPEGKERHNALLRIEANLDPNKALDGEKEMAVVWADHERSSPAPEAYEKSLAEQWRKTGCAADGAPYVVRAFLARVNTAFFMDHIFSSPFAIDSLEKPKLAAAFLDEAHCAGAHGLSEADKAKLEEIAATGAPQAPKP